MASPSDIRAGGAYVEVRADNSKLKGDLKNSEEMLKGLANSFGGASQLANWTKAIKGAGAVAGLTLIGNVIRDASQRVVELNNQFNRGEISLGQYREELAKSIPVIGSFVAAGRNIRELITGENYESEVAAEKIRKEAEAIDRRTKAMVDSKNAIRDMNREIERMGMTGIDQTIFDIRNRYNDTIEKINQSPLPDAAKKRQRMAATDLRNAQFEQAYKDAAKSIMDGVQTNLQEYLKKVAELNKMKGLGVLDKSQYNQALRAASADFGDSGFFGNLVGKAESFWNQRVMGSGAGVEAGNIFAGIGRFLGSLAEMKNSKSLSLEGVSFGGFGKDVSGAGSTQVTSYLSAIARSSASIDQKTVPQTFQ